ncbi:MAG: hypothetical protein HC866_22665 [Leptolyngbyaceae cyanobacterium RU_5_1]|nr:hypothetical protein [Leptolyngbyaceae cyanobacterium RU_5_1]
MTPPDELALEWRNQQQALADLNAWFDSLPEPEPIPLTCAHCQHFQSFQHDITRGYCQRQQKSEWVGDSVRMLNIERKTSDLACPELEVPCEF